MLSAANHPSGVCLLRSAGSAGGETTRAVLRFPDLHRGLPAIFSCLTVVVARHEPRPAVIQFPGGHTAGVTPVPIPNTVVKPRRADDTALVTVWERRSPPGFFLMGRIRKCGFGPFSFPPTDSSVRRSGAERRSSRFKPSGHINVPLGLILKKGSEQSGPFSFSIRCAAA